MRTKIAGLILIIIGALAAVPFIVLLLTGGLMNIMDNPIVLLYLVAGIYFIVLGSAIRVYRKWAWYVGIVTLGIGFIGNLITIFFSFSLYLLAALLIGGFVLYALISEKRLFLPLVANQ